MRTSQWLDSWPSGGSTRLFGEEAGEVEWDGLCEKAPEGDISAVGTSESWGGGEGAGCGCCEMLTRAVRPSACERLGPPDTTLTRGTLDVLTVCLCAAAEDDLDFFSARLAFSPCHSFIFSVSRLSFRRGS